MGSASDTDLQIMWYRIKCAFQHSDRSRKLFCIEYISIICIEILF
jgi:hypothetical protein